MVQHKIDQTISNSKQLLTCSIKGMHCASCAALVEDTLSKMQGIKNPSVNLASEKVKFNFDPNLVDLYHVEAKLEEFGYQLLLPKPIDKESVDANTSPITSQITKDKQQKLLELLAQRHQVETVLPFAIFIFIAMLWDQLAVQFNWMPAFFLPMALFDKISFILASVVLFWAGTDFLKAIPRFISTGRANMDTLVGIGTVAAYVYSSLILLFPEAASLLSLPSVLYFDVTIVVISFIKLGKYLEANSKLRTGEAIERLYNLQAKNAIVLRDGLEIEINADDVLIGDIVVIKPGMKIPVDGVVISGNSSVDESLVTGEPLPVDVNSGSTVIGGTLNKQGAFKMTAQKVGADTLLANIIKLVEDAQGSKAPIQRLADSVALIFVPIVLIIAALTLTFWMVIGSQFMPVGDAFSLGLLCTVGILVIACPCALGLATPTAIIVGVGMGASEGILIKSAESLEKLHSVKTIVLDKTGTITKGQPEVVHIESVSDRSEVDLLSIATGLEHYSEHPLAIAIQDAAKTKSITNPDVTDFSIIEGKGVIGSINSIKYIVGNPALMTDNNISINIGQIEGYSSKGMTVVLIADTAQVLGLIAISDTIKPNAKTAISDLHKLGLEVIMLTGDNQGAANHIALQVGLDSAIAQVLPAQKAEKILELKTNGKVVAMVGDGVNDAPAIASANVGIAMGTGTDVAIESADIILLHGDLTKLVKAIKLSRLTMRKIRQNLFWAFFYNVIGIPIAAGILYPFTGWLLNPGIAGAAMAFSSVSVVTNTLLMKRIKL